MLIKTELPNYTGRILALNLQKCKRFQCGGFWLNVNKPFATVEPGPAVQHDMLRQGLMDGRLIDITDQTARGLEMNGSTHSAPKDQGVVGNKVYFQIDSKGNVLVVIPKDDDEEAKYEEEIRNKGSITAEHFKVADHGIATEPMVNPGDAGDLMNQIGNKLETAKEKVYIPKLK